MVVFGGEVALICVALVTLTLLAAWTPKLTSAVAGKSCPERTTGVPPAFGPSAAWAAGAVAKNGAGPESDPGVAASMNPTPRFEIPKSSFVESTSSISVRAPPIHKSGDWPMTLRLWPSNTVMIGGAPTFSLTYKNWLSRENTMPFTADVACEPIGFNVPSRSNTCEAPFETKLTANLDPSEFAAAIVSVPA